MMKMWLCICSHVLQLALCSDHFTLTESFRPTAAVYFLKGNMLHVYIRNGTVHKCCQHAT